MSFDYLYAGVTMRLGPRLVRNLSGLPEEGRAGIGFRVTKRTTEPVGL